MEGCQSVGVTALLMSALFHGCRRVRGKAVVLYTESSRVCWLLITSC